MPPRLESCIRKVKKKGKVKNAWAVCVKATGIKKKKGGGWTRRKKTKKK